MTLIKSIYTLKSISFFMLPSFVLGLDLLLSSSTFSNRMLWSSTASLVAILPLITFSLKNLIVLNCWKSYMSLFISYFKLFLLNLYSHPVISSNSCLISLVRVSYLNTFVSIFITFCSVFFYGNEMVLHFSVFSLKHSNWLSDSFANSFMIK